MSLAFFSYADTAALCGARFVQLTLLARHGYHHSDARSHSLPRPPPVSKLGERIRRALQANAKPMGFAAVARAQNPSLLLAASFSTPAADDAARALAQGADTCLFGVGDIKSSDMDAMVKATGDAPLGVWPQRLDREVVEKLSGTGVDYVLFSPEAAAATALLESDLGYVLTYEGDLADIHVRTLQALPLDAVFLRHWQQPLTVRGQMELIRVASLSNRPVMLTVPPDIELKELESLRDSGVVIAALDGDQKGALDALPTLRRAVDALPARRHRREEHPEALVPRAEPAAPSADEEDEEDDDSW